MKTRLGALCALVVVGLMFGGSPASASHEEFHCEHPCSDWHYELIYEVDTGDITGSAAWPQSQAEWHETFPSEGQAILEITSHPDRGYIMHHVWEYRVDSSSRTVERRPDAGDAPSSEEPSPSPEPSAVATSEALSIPQAVLPLGLVAVVMYLLGGRRVRRIMHR